MFMHEMTTDHDAYYWMIKNSVVPRPIAWVSTMDDDGVYNVAPYSFFNLVTLDPPILEICFGGEKDSYDNIKETGEFVVNLVSEGLVERQAMTAAVVPPHVDEARLVGLQLAASEIVGVPRLADTRVALECVYHSEVRFGDMKMVFGRIVGTYVDDRILGPDGRIDVRRYRPVGRLGGSDYAVVTDGFTVKIPDLSHLVGVRPGGDKYLPPPDPALSTHARTA